MRYSTILIITCMLTVMPFSEGYAWHHDKQVTPYGDHCPRCSDYGTCDSLMGHEDAKKALLDYYNKKGLTVEIIRKSGNFIKAKIKDKNDIVDIIIFDRRTGRVRSIY